MKTMTWMFGAAMAGWLCAGAAVAVAQPQTVLQADQLDHWNKRQVTSQAQADGTTVFSVKARTQAVGVTKFEVDTQATYTVSGEFRSAGDVDVTAIYFGLRPLDDKGRGILPGHVATVSGAALTELAADAGKGDTTLRLKDASTWNNKQKYALVAFNAKADLSDLPNRAISPVIETGSIVKQDDGTYELKLTKPLGQAYPAGTAVRQHMSGGTYIYAGGGGRAVKGQWTTFTGKVQGVQPQGLNNNKWRPGTKQAQLVILHNGKADQPALEFRHVKVEKE